MKYLNVDLKSGSICSDPEWRYKSGLGEYHTTRGIILQSSFVEFYITFSLKTNGKTRSKGASWEGCFDAYWVIVMTPVTEDPEIMSGECAGEQLYSELNQAFHDILMRRDWLKYQYRRPPEFVV